MRELPPPYKGPFIGSPRPREQPCCPLLLVSRLFSAPETVLSGVLA